MSDTYTFEVWAYSPWDEDEGQPFRVGRYGTPIDAAKAIAQWPHLDCWVERKNEPSH